MINPLNAELNPICHMLALLEAHHILHISRLKVKSVYEDLYHIAACRTNCMMTRKVHCHGINELLQN